VTRDKQEHRDALESYVTEARHARIHREQDRGVRNRRQRNQMLQRAGEAALFETDSRDHGKAAKHDLMLRQDAMLAQELARRNQDKSTRQREIQRICENDEELRELQLKLKAAYMNKERHLQINQKQSLHQRARQEEEIFNRKRDQERQRAALEEARKLMNQKEASLRQARINNEQIHVKQMRDREDAYNEYVSDKKSVDQLMQDITNEMRSNEEGRLRKKEMLRRDMNQSLADRAAQLSDRRAADAAADVASAEYRQIQDIRKKVAEDRAAEAAKAAEKIFNKLKAEAERKQAEENRIASAIQLLRKEDADRRRDEAERTKREKEHKSKMEMMEANEAQKLHKIEMRAKMMADEQRLVSRMMAKFKEDDKKESMEELQRQQAKLQFKMNILDQMEAKRQRYEMMKRKDESARRKVAMEEMYQKRVVEEARRRLLMQHAAALKDFLPKGVLKKMEDLRLLDTDGDGVISNAEAQRAQRAMMEYGDLNGDGQLSAAEKESGFEQFKIRASQRRAHFKAPPPPQSMSTQASGKSTRPW